MTTSTLTKTIAAVKTQPLWKEFRSKRMEPAELLAALGLHEALPVPVGKICNLLGVKVYQSPTLATSGESLVDGDSARAWLNSSESRVRQRFTLAHELGHILLHPEGKMYRGAATSSPLEREANTFAAKLLIPEGLYWAKVMLPWKKYDVQEMASLFDVSVPAMKARLTELHPYKLK